MIDTLLNLMGLGAVSIVTIGGYLKARQFVRRRLRYVDAVQKPSTPIVAGIGAGVVIGALAALPVITLIPFFGFPTGIIAGLAVGAGVAHGARDVRSLPQPDEF